MSIINDMLRDLDSQRVRQAAANDGVLLGLAVSDTSNAALQKIMAAAAVLCALLLLAVFIRPYAAGLIEGKRAAGPASSIQMQSGSWPQPDMSVTASSQPTEIAEQEIVFADDDNLYSEVVYADDDSLHTDPVLEQADEPMQAFSSLQPPVEASTVVIKHQLSPEQRIARNLEQARLAIQNGNDGRAVKILGETLSLDSGQHESRLLLVQLHLRRQRNLDAETLLASGLAQHPGHAPYARLYAQLLVEQSRFSEAINHLQAALPGAARDAEYQALLAGLYQRTGRAMAAARHYQVALQLAPEKGEWWMGLGISLEQSGSRVNAYAAYQRALRFLSDHALHEYVNSRIKNLSRMRGAR